MFGSVWYTGQHKNSNTSVVVSTFSTSRRFRYMTFMGSKTINWPSFCLSPALKWKCHDFSFWFCIMVLKRLGFVLHIFLLRRPRHYAPSELVEPDPSEPGLPPGWDARNTTLFPGPFFCFSRGRNWALPLIRTSAYYGHLLITDIHFCWRQTALFVPTEIRLRVVSVSAHR